MNTSLLSVREIKKEDINSILEYWFSAKVQFLLKMGVDITRMPKRSDFSEMLVKQLSQPYREKQSYCIIWLVDNVATGHCNVNKIIFGREAYMHLHIWNTGKRQKGFGTDFVKMSLTYFFENLELKKLYCEPYALNPAPNKTLEKVGFKFVKNYITIPGEINFEQPVNRWELSYEDFEKIQ